MILNKETKEKFGYNLSELTSGSGKLVVGRCDICNSIFEKTLHKITSARKRSNSEIDVCKNSTCHGKKQKMTIVKKYGVTYIGQIEGHKEKVLNTLAINYGDGVNIDWKLRHESSRNTCQEKYGCDNVFQVEHIKDKCKETMMAKYGVKHNMSSEIIKETRRRNNIKKYGMDSPNQTKLISSKISKSWLIKIYDELLSNEKVKPMFTLEEFKGLKKECHKFKCVECGNEFENNYIGVQCYKCHPLPRSLVENDLKDYIETQYKGEIKYNARKPFNNEFEVDILMPELKLAIELNGNYYHSEIAGSKDKEYHKSKTDKCRLLGINLIHIFEDEWKQDTDNIKKFINSIISSIDYPPCQTIKDIIDVINNNSINHQVSINNNKLIVNVDNRFNNNFMFSKLGFKMISEILPKCYYVKKNNYQNRLISMDVAADINDYDRIWDCGNTIIEWTRK